MVLYNGTIKMKEGVYGQFERPGKHKRSKAEAEG
jgi:hypothetical protein